MNVVNIFGVPYKVSEITTDQSPIKMDGNDGYVELYSKKIFIRTGYEDDPATQEDISSYKKEVLRHEMWHAIFHECGLSDYTDDERLVEFLAVQFPKISDMIKEAEKLYNKKEKL